MGRQLRPHEIGGVLGQTRSSFASIEYIPPADAALLYGMNAASGALVLWSRGHGPHATAERNR
jgi:hypothetical protein